MEQGAGVVLGKFKAIKGIFAFGKKKQKLDGNVHASTRVGWGTGFNANSPDGPQPNGAGRQNPQTSNFDDLPINELSINNGRKFSGHALDQMQNRGVTPTVVENTINTRSRVSSSTKETFEYIDEVNGVNVVVNLGGRIVTMK